MIRTAVGLAIVSTLLVGCAAPLEDEQSDTAEADLSSQPLGCDGPALQAADVLGRFVGDATTVTFGTYAVEGRQRFCPTNRPCGQWTRTTEHVRLGRLGGSTSLRRGANDAIALSFDGFRSGPVDDSVGWQDIPVGSPPDASLLGALLTDTSHTTFTTTPVGRKCLAMRAQRSETWSSGSSEWEYTLRAHPTPAARQPISSYLKAPRRMEIRCSNYSKYLQYTCTGQVEGDHDSYSTATVKVSRDGRSLDILDGLNEFQRSYPLAADGKADIDTTRGEREELVTIDANGSYLNLRVNLSDRQRYSSQCGPYAPSGWATAMERTCTGTLLAP
jgi:hypothetical protein